jgi:fatty acid desaturase
MSSEYVDTQQRSDIAFERSRLLWLGEWPTWLLIAVIYGGWLLTLAFWRQIGAVAGTLLMIWWCAWYMSLQHELIHGHPTRWPWVNRLFGYVPLAIWYPYGLYRDSHLRHHNDFHLTMPALDTESYYVSPARWAEMNKSLRALHWFNKTFWGRLLVGPAIAVAGAWAEALRQPLRGDWRQAPMWLGHVAMLAALLWWVRHGVRCVADILSAGDLLSGAVAGDGAVVLRAPPGAGPQAAYSAQRGRIRISPAVPE